MRYATVGDVVSAGGGGDLTHEEIEHMLEEVADQIDAVVGGPIDGTEDSLLFRQCKHMSVMLFVDPDELRASLARLEGAEADDTPDAPEDEEAEEEDDAEVEAPE